MEITYNLREKDLLRGRSLMRKYSPELKRIKQTAIVTITLLPCVNFLLRQNFILPEVIRMLIEMLMIGVLYWVAIKTLTPLLDRLGVAVLRRKSSGLFGEHKITLTEESLIESTSVNESHHRWAGIQGVYENKDYILIMIGSQQGHIIPKRAFASHDVAQQFYEQAQEYTKRYSQPDAL